MTAYSVSLDDIRNLSVEIQALVRAGLPLEIHLREAGRGHGARLQKVTEHISSQLSAGEPLESVLADGSVGDSRMLSSAVAAGIRSGDLAKSIEMLGDMASDLAELRRRILESLSYPMTVAIIAVIMFTLFIQSFLARMTSTFDALGIAMSPWIRYLIDLSISYPYWPWAFPIAAAIMVLFWTSTGRADAMAFRGPERLLLLIPGVRGILRDLRFYTLTRMLSLLIDRQVSLSEALLIAGSVTGSPALDSACRNAAAALQTGQPIPAPGRRRWSHRDLPPLLATCLRNCSAHEEQLCERLRSVSGHYHRRLQMNVSWLRNVIPVAMFVIVAGGSVVLYGLTVFWPVTELYRNLAGY
jgi:type II secretory pathway component PulF